MRLAFFVLLRKAPFVGLCIASITCFTFGQEKRQAQITIPFELEQGRIYVGAFVNGRGPYRFMVDTGASGHGRLDERLVKELSLKYSGTALNSDSVNTAEVRTVVLDSLRIGGMTLDNANVLSRDYNRNLRPGAKILYGLIGRDFFAERLLTIDYPRKQMTVSRGSLVAGQPGVVNYEDTLAYPIKLGSFEAEGHIDTGSNADAHLPMEWSKKLGLTGLEPAGEGRRANTVFKLFAAKEPIEVNVAHTRARIRRAMFSELANAINIGGMFFQNNGCVIMIDIKRRLLKVEVTSADGTAALRERERNLTRHPAADRDPSWSPDGKNIAFVSDRDGNFEVYLMNSDGSNQRRLTKNSSADRNPSWSRDSKRIVFQSARDGNEEVYVMNADGSAQTRLTDHPGDDIFPAFSPDGRKITFTSGRNGNLDIFEMNSDGSQPKPLTSHKNRDAWSRYSPDGKKLVFFSRRDSIDDNDEIYVMNTDGSSVRRLTTNAGNDFCPDWSPDGKQIAFISIQPHNELYVYRINADGTLLKRLTAIPDRVSTPSWSPDGKAIAFSSQRDGNLEVYLMEVEPM